MSQQQAQPGVFLYHYTRQWIEDRATPEHIALVIDELRIRNKKEWLRKSVMGDKNIAILQWNLHYFMRLYCAQIDHHIEITREIMKFLTVRHENYLALERIKELKQEKAKAAKKKKKQRLNFF